MLCSIRLIVSLKKTFTDLLYFFSDFAARNCLVTSDLHVKIGDFGIGEDLYRVGSCNLFWQLDEKYMLAVYFLLSSYKIYVLFIFPLFHIQKLSDASAADDVEKQYCKNNDQFLLSPQSFQLYSIIVPSFKEIFHEKICLKLNNGIFREKRALQIVDGFLTGFVKLPRSRYSC